MALPVRILAVVLLSVPLACGGEEPPSGSDAADDPLSADLAGFDPGVAEAIEGARDEVRGRASDPDEWGRLGMTYEANFIPHLALFCYDEAVRLSPAAAKWHYRRSRALTTLGRVEEATTALATAATHTRSYAPAHWRLGFAHLGNGELEAAAAAFQAALAIDAAQVPARVGLARVRLQEDDPASALAELERAERADREDRTVHSLLATAYRQLGREADAEREGELGRGAIPDWVDPWESEMLRHRVDTVGLAVLRSGELIEEGNHAEAIRLLEELSGTESDNITFLVQLTTAYVRGERYEEAMATARRCLEIEPRNVTALLHLAGVQAQLADFAAARATLEAAAGFHPQDARVHRALGSVLYKSGDRRAATDAWRASFAADERQTDLLYQVGMVELQIHRWEQARDAFQLAIDRRLDTPDVFVGLAKARLELGDLDGAATALAALRGRAPADPRRLEQVRREIDARRAPGR
ncbi:MAG: tetratricopeptide repeat protein [Planctomycetota bacterium]